MIEREKRVASQHRAFHHQGIQREGQSGAEASQAPVTSPALPQPAPARARTLEAGKRWARLAQARACDLFSSDTEENVLHNRITHLKLQISTLRN